MQVMHTYFCGDSFFLQWQHIGEELQFLGCTDMQDMQAAVVFFGNLDGRQGRFKTGFFIPDDRMIRWLQYLFFLF